MESSYILIFSIAILAFIYYYLTYTYDYFKKQGVKCASNVLPGIGNIFPVFLIKENLSTVCNKLYKKCSSNSSMIGMFHLRTPLLVIRDPELIRTVLVKDFQSFSNNMLQLHDELDPFMAKNPFFARDQVWKDSRSKMISNMSQKKLKILFRIMHQVSTKFETYLDKILPKDVNKELELKEAFIAFTGELVANTALGIDGRCLELNPDVPSFNDTMKKLVQLTYTGAIRQTISLYLPNLAAALGVSFMPRRMSNFFKNTIADVLQHRKKNNVFVEDFLQMTIEGLEKPSVDVVTGHISSYFFDAYETSASIAAFAAYNLSYHPEVQMKAREEINETLERHQELTYDALKEMTYLGQIIYETVRLHPILGATFKVCTKAITLGGSDGQTCCLKPGQFLCIPVQSLHTDEQYWKNPEVFDPDRFSEERKDEITKFVYLPFSEGPRMCAGMRYGIMTVKTILVMVLRKFDIECSPKMIGPLKYDQSNFLTAAESGLWARLRRIDETNN